jgi:aminopeptidase N
MPPLRAGTNELAFRFTAPLAPAGAPLIWYHDAAAGQDFVYTLLVPSDAHRLFPCFDQPSLRGRFRVELELPPGWTSVTNVDAGFTQPLPTYLFAFAAGPFEKVEAEGVPRVYVRPSRRNELEPAVARMNGDAMRFFARWFGVPYAFPKLDVVLLPAFPYGGMEHAGAIFYRENALLFDHAPTPAELHRRSTLIYHEVAHQWFGNLVTMRWFDDLWLKEGFATFTAYKALERLEPDSASWLRFLQVVKPPAYAVDATPGTTPIWQELGNLDDAKSAYGPIVYNKAPAVLRELEGRLSEERFRAGVKLFLERHAFSSARWDDLVAALAEAGEQDLRRWSERWIRAPGMPCVRAGWLAEAGKVKAFTLRQQGARGEPATWPVHVELLVGFPGGRRRELAVDLDAPSAEVGELAGGPVPEFVVANARDVAYGRFLLDAASASYWLAHLHDETDPMLRAVVRQQLADGVRECEIDPRDLVACLLRVLDVERDAATHASLLDSLGTTLLRYMDAERRAPQLAELVAKGLAILAGPTSGRGSRPCASSCACRATAGSSTSANGPPAATWRTPGASRTASSRAPPCSPRDARARARPRRSRP